MKKYWFIIKTEIMSNLQYRFDVIFGFVSYFILLFILFNLWRYLYSDTSGLINGYSMSQMMWYVVMTEILWMTLGGRKFNTKICNDVKTGNITYNINKPYSYIGYSLSMHLGDILVKGVLYVLIGMLIGFIFLGHFPSLSIIEIIVVIIASLLATIISIFIIMALGLISFFIEDATPFYWVYSKLILILGTIFPIEYFPTVLQKVLNFSPIYVVSYGPAKLFVDFSWDKAITIIGAQLIYLVITYGICKLIYQKGVKRISVNGG